MDVLQEAESVVKEALSADEIAGIKAAVAEPYTEEGLGQAVRWLETVRIQEVLLELALRGVVVIHPGEPMRFSLSDLGKQVLSGNNFPEALVALFEEQDEGTKASQDPQ